MRELKDLSTKDLEHKLYKVNLSLAKLDKSITYFEGYQTRTGRGVEVVGNSRRRHAKQTFLRIRKDINKILIERKKTVRPADKVVYAAAMRWGQQEFHNIMREQRI